MSTITAPAPGKIVVGPDAQYVGRRWLRGFATYEEMSVMLNSYGYGLNVDQLRQIQRGILLTAEAFTDNLVALLEDAGLL